MSRIMILTVAVLFAFLVSCNCKKKCQEETVGATNDTTIVTGSYATAPLIIYKTKGDYRDLVPVMLSTDKQEVVSFPGIKDIYYNGELSLPVELSDGYLLDLRGIGPDVAFLSITYQEYSELDQVPSAYELLSKVVDNDPIIELYICGNRTDLKEDIVRINDMISEGTLGSCDQKR